jgi:hypothetical protein
VVVCLVLGLRVPVVLLWSKIRGLLQVQVSILSWSSRFDNCY